MLTEQREPPRPAKWVSLSMMACYSPLLLLLLLLLLLVVVVGQGW